MENEDFVKFLGTAGARFVVSKQLRSSAGTWCYFGGVHLCIDPGPGTLVRLFTGRPKLDPEKLDAIILTHRHLDHSTDINVLIEAMTHGRMQRRGAIFAPLDALSSSEPVIFSYLHKAVERVETLTPGGRYTIGRLSLSTPVRNDHGVDTYGLKFTLDYGTIAFVSDTRYFPALADHYQSDLLILNVVLKDPIPSTKIFHLNIFQARQLIENIRPRAAVITHFGMTMLKSRPWELAEEMSCELGIPILAASDGMMLRPRELITGSRN